MRIYTAQFNGVAITAVQDLFAIVAGTNSPVEIHDFHLMQTSDLGDAQEEVLLIQLKQGATVAGSGGSAPTPVPRDVDDVAASATARCNDTTQANTGTIVTHYSWGWNIRVPFDKIFTPETRPYAKGARRLVLALSGAPADSITVSGSITWSEG